MIKQLLLLTLALNFSFSIFAQSPELEGTTLEEFNYVTKGYPNLKKMGLDEKSGYKMVEIAGFTSYDRDFTFYKLMKDGEDLPRAIYVNYKNSYHYCIPNPNTSEETIWKKYVSDINYMSGDTKSAYIFCLTRLIMYCWSDYTRTFGLEEETEE